ncbi:Zinc finger, CCCH-type [Phytophthora cactorum]|nr:Zinc finger, CCCH-type [Phytophthora cactorum]
MRNAEATITSQATRSQIRQANGTQVCIHFQAASGCSFPRCRHAHEMRQQPPDVFRWVTSHDGALKDGRPQRE